MSQALRRTAFSPNIKERRDCSCAIFDTTGRLVAQSKDIPVHLGAMPMSVKACIEQLGEEMVEDTMALLNDPFSGGSHLPDLTLVSPVFHRNERVAFTANRAHHADVGGISPGSMPGMATSIDEEGVLIKPRIIVRDGKLVKETIEDLLDSTRTPNERLGDLSAQIAANIVGGRRLQEVAKNHGWDIVTRTFYELRDYSAQMMKNAISELEGKDSEFVDFMDSDGVGNWRIPIKIKIKFEHKVISVDFEGTASQVLGNINCPLASTLSSIYYVFITIFGTGIPTNEGCWSILDVRVPIGSLLNPQYPAPVSAGNVETSQRIVDVALGALADIIPNRIPACSQGTMNNLTIGGIDYRTGKPFSFYETIGGGAGAIKGANGASGIQVHMTNTLNTPIEALEIAYPLCIRAYKIRQNSGGLGRWNGGEGIVREIEILADDCEVSIQSERRYLQPWGLQGGMPGKAGLNELEYQKTKRKLEAKTTIKTLAGTIIRIETPGGGGWGIPSKI